MKKFALGFILLLVLCSVLFSLLKIDIAEAEPKTIVVPDDYLTIGWAIGNASEGDTIYVKKGSYYEHVTINKSISLIGENRSTTIIDGNGLLEIVNIVAHDVFLSGFTVRNGYRTIVVASQITLSRYNTIHGCVLRQASFGIILWGEIYADASGHSYMPSELNVIEENIIETTYAIELGDSHNNKIADNIIENGAYGIHVDGYSHDNLITGNLLQNIRAGGEALTLMGRNATIIGNTFKANDWGLFIYGNMPLTHHVYHNNFIANVRHVELLYGPSIVWDSGYPSGGNYWSDYKERYPNATEIDGTGIWDTPYVIDENNQDNYPLINRYGSVRNLDTNLTYLTIQSAIDAPETLNGHTILVDAGTYYEHVFINKSISLIGENRSTTVIDGNETGNVVTITTGNVSISGFTIQHGESCIYLSSSSGVTINDNAISNNFEGIHLNSSNGNDIADNLISPYAAVGIFLGYSNGNVIRGNIINPEIGLDQIGILLTYSTENSIINNTILNNLYDGIKLIWSADYNIITGNTISNNDYGIYAIYSNSNIISNNMIVENANGIFMEGGSEKNTVIGNTLSENWAAISFSHSTYDNIVCHNNFFSNTHQIGNPIYSDPLSSNRWDNCLEGNYWSDYTGQDANFDGIGDTPYIADGDNYPLMGMFSDFKATPEYLVQTICNSSISDFQFTGTAIGFNVSGEEGTTGFCRICIPTALMETYKVFVNGTEVPYTLLPCSNSTHSFLYFTYNHSKQEVIVIPEFPTWTSMLLLFVVLTINMAIYKRRLPKTPIS